ncbi:hypothetical protein Syun_007804 [Stephania yunnanensis]|uniref:WD repeat-containing protein 48 n=1 Tax=Stephania yunnanensis TaxID=152371 RepID=A0AAP0L0K6_9MAGN
MNRRVDWTSAMHRVGSAGNTSNSSRPRREKRLTYVLNNANATKHCAGVNCLSVLRSPATDGCDYLFTGSRDGTLKRWALTEDAATCSATFESHVDWVNDVVLAGSDTLVSCSSDTTLKAWKSSSDGICIKTLRQHSDYVTCLAAAEKNSNIIASGGLGGEVFIWDLEAALVSASKSTDAMEDDGSNGVIGSGNSGMTITGLRTISSSSSLSVHPPQTNGYTPIAAKGHKESVYALAMNDSGTLLVSGGTEKVVRVWDPRSGSKTMKLRGHTDNIRALLLDSSGRYCLSGSSDSIIRLWDLSQQRCVHSYAVHTDSVWALASTPTFSHVYSGGRDLSLYVTDLSTRESLLLCTKEHPILQLAMHDDSIWVATTDSSVHRAIEIDIKVPVYKDPSFTIHGTPAIVQHEILNNRRQVLTKDTADSVQLWDITKGVVVEDYGKVSFEEKKEELFEMVSFPAWFAADSRLGSLSIHLDTPQCFSAEMYSIDLGTIGVTEDHKINLAEETLKGLLAPWLAKRRLKSGSQASANGDASVGKDSSVRSYSHQRAEDDDNTESHSSMVHPAFEFSSVSPPSIITEGSHGGPWRKKITDLDGTEDEKDIPWWCLDCVLNKRIPAKDNTKCSFYLHPSEGSTVQFPLTQGKLSAPRILRIHKVINYVIEKMVLDKVSDSGNSDGTFSPGLAGGLSQFSGDGAFLSGLKPRKLKPSIEILCNNQVLSPDMSLATVRAIYGRNLMTWS